MTFARIKLSFLYNLIHFCNYLYLAHKSMSRRSQPVPTAVANFDSRMRNRLKTCRYAQHWNRVWNIAPTGKKQQLLIPYKVQELGQRLTFWRNGKKKKEAKTARLITLQPSCTTLKIATFSTNQLSAQIKINNFPQCYKNYYFFFLWFKRKIQHLNEKLISFRWLLPETWTLITRGTRKIAPDM